MAEGIEITHESIMKVMEEIFSVIPKKGFGEVYWVCDTVNEWIGSGQFCYNKECSNCTKYRKALKEANIYERW